MRLQCEWRIRDTETNVFFVIKAVEGKQVSNGKSNCFVIKKQHR